MSQTSAGAKTGKAEKRPFFPCRTGSIYNVTLWVTKILPMAILFGYNQIDQRKAVVEKEMNLKVISREVYDFRRN